MNDLSEVIEAAKVDGWEFAILNQVFRFYSPVLFKAVIKLLRWALILFVSDA